MKPFYFISYKAFKKSFDFPLGTSGNRRVRGLDFLRVSLSLVQKKKKCVLFCCVGIKCNKCCQCVNCSGLREDVVKDTATVVEKGVLDVGPPEPCSSKKSICHSLDEVLYLETWMELGAYPWVCSNRS